MKTVRIYTDGACANNQSRENSAGWGTVLEFGDVRKELSGGELNSSNNRMELSALLAGLRALKQAPLHLEIFSDSSYLINCFRQGWYLGWQKNGWKNSKKEPVENRDLWEGILEGLAPHQADFYLVKGHLSMKNLTDAAFDKLYREFLEKNHRDFTPEDYRHIIEMNNRCDALAVAACK